MNNSPTVSITTLGEFEGYEEGMGPFAPTIRFRTEDGLLVVLVDRDLDDVFEFGMLVADHPETGKWFPDVGSIDETVRAQLEEQTGKTIKLEVSEA